MAAGSRCHVAQTAHQLSTLIACDIRWCGDRAAVGTHYGNGAAAAAAAEMLVVISLFFFYFPMSHRTRPRQSGDDSTKLAAECMSCVIVLWQTPTIIP